MTTRRVRRFRFLGRVLGGLLGLAVLVAVGGVFAVRRAASVLDRLLRDYATQTIQRSSHDVYHLSVGTIRFNWALRRFDVDSLVLTTDSAANARRSSPLAAMHVALRHCTVTGIGLRKLVTNKGLYVRRVGCRDVTVAVQVPRGAETGADIAPVQAAAPADSARAARTTILALQRNLRLPAFAPRLHIRTIFFPQSRFLLTRERAGGGQSRFELERLAWRVQRLVIDPDVPLAASRFLFSQAIDIAADNFVHHPDALMQMRVGRLRVSLTDSTLDVRAISYGPTVSDAAFARQRPYRRSRMRVDVEHVRATGVDFGKLLRRGGIFMRKLELDTVDVDVWSDKRLPKNPRPRLRLTPQAWLAEGPGAWGIDTLTVSGRVVYREQQHGHARPGVLTFDRLRAVATNVSHVPGRKSRTDVMTLRASAMLMNAGRLEATFLVPLDAPRFDMTFFGSLGPMPAIAFNEFIDHVFQARIAGGQVVRVDFRAVVRGGVARGELTPRYENFGITVTGKGSTGLFAAGGGIGSAIRGIASFFANRTKVRSTNPDRPNRPPLSAPIEHTFVPTETLIAFVWTSVRDALLSVIMK